MTASAAWWLFGHASRIIPKEDNLNGATNRQYKGSQYSINVKGGGVDPKCTILNSIYVSNDVLHLMQAEQQEDAAEDGRCYS